MKITEQNNYRTQKEGRASQSLGKMLEKHILAGKWRAGELLPSVRQLCQTHDTCIDTAVRALKALEASGLVISEPRRGYRVLPRANTPQLGCPLAFIVPGTGENALNILEAQMAGAYQQMAARHGQALLVIGVKGQNHAAILSQLSASRAWGVIFNAHDPALLQALLDMGMPVVVADAINVGLDVDEVNQDGFRGALLAAQHVGRGSHNRIGWLGYKIKDGDPQTIERYAGAAGGLAQCGKSFTTEFISEVTIDDNESALKAARKMLAHPQRPTAVLALWQNLHEVLVTAAQENGLVPGKDIELIGWCIEETFEGRHAPQFKAGLGSPAVTWSLTTMTETAMARLEERRNNPQLPVVHLRIPAQLRIEKQGEEK